MSELQPRIQAEMDLMWEQRALDQSVDDGPSREEAIDDAIDHLYGLEALDEETPNGASARKLRENLEIIYDLDPEVSACMTIEQLIDKARTYDTLRTRWESVQRLISDERDIQSDILAHDLDEQYVLDVGGLKQWFERLAQLRNLKPDEQLFVEQGIAGLDARGVYLWGEKYGHDSLGRAHSAHWLLNDAETHELEQELGEEYYEFIGSDAMVREIDGGCFTRGEIRKFVEWANENGKTGNRHAAAAILWAFANEQERFTRPDIVIGALSRIACNSHEDDWSGFGESIKTGVIEDILDVDTTKAIVETVADYGYAGHYPQSITARELGYAVGTLAKMGNLELSETPQNLELSTSIR